YGQSGRTLWDAYSQRSSKYDPKVQEQTWRSLKIDGETTIATLIHFAKEGGWKPAAAAPEPGSEFGQRTPPHNDSTERKTSNYRETQEGLFRVEVKGPPGKQVEILHQLTNFTARIVADLSRDDGAESTRAFEIEAHIRDQSATFSVSAAQFNGMRWATEHL